MGSDWKKPMPKMHASDVDDPEPNDPEYRSDVLCGHGDIQPGGKMAKGINKEVGFALTA